MKNLVNIIIAGFLMLSPLFAQDDTSAIAKVVPQEATSEPYDPLIPQLFAFDKDLDIYAGINNADNQIVIVKHATENGKDILKIEHRYLVDVVKKRHDDMFIYRPKSVAIYEGYVVFLASQRDSCYLGVLNIETGALVKKLYFQGSASAFSYSPQAKKLYIVGENATGFDVITLDTHHGMGNIALADAAEVHYQKPRMSEQILKEDPWGIGITIIAISVVFIALILLYLVFRQVGVQLTVIQERRKSKATEAAKPKPVTVAAAIPTGSDVYAAIAVAIHLYTEELQNAEDTVLTINKVSRTYSPWSSKIHGLNTYFKR
jgi:Na+-transporting methylmalonyl-CoA/oxaloacetate decarboxylase gamma subunit